MLWVRREPRDNLSTLTDVWAGVQGEVEVTLLLRPGRPGKGGVSAEATGRSRHGSLGVVNGALCKDFHHCSTTGKSWQQTGLEGRLKNE